MQPQEETKRQTDRRTVTEAERENRKRAVQNAAIHKITLTKMYLKKSDRTECQRDDIRSFHGNSTRNGKNTKCKESNLLLLLRERGGEGKAGKYILTSAQSFLTFSEENKLHHLL